MRRGAEPMGGHRRRLSILAGIAIVSGLGSECFAQNPGRPIRFIGEYSNLRHTEEHACGYTIELWRDGDSTVGLIFASQGMNEDMPAGMLENVRFDSRTGALRFTAKLTMGAILLPGGGLEPSRDLFEFSGALKAAVLTGELKWSDPRKPTRPALRESVQLKIQREEDVPPAGSYAEWKRWADEILKGRGPKW
jgi:hypothetical protein